MPSSSNITARAEELRKQFELITGSTELTGAQKSEQLEAFQKDWEAHKVDVKNSERQAEMRAQLGGGTDQKGESPEAFGPETFMRKTRNLHRSRTAIAAGFLRSPAYKECVERLGHGAGSIKGNVDKTWEVSTKDATEAANLMGEGLYGASGPTAAGQAPFLPGAFGPGIQPQFIPGVVEQRLYELMIADLFDSIPVTSPDITYLTESVANMNANAVAEAGLYPFSSEEFARVYEQVGKVANAATITDEVIKDAPILFNFLQGRLLEGIQRQEEVQLLAGGGYPGVNGLLNRSSGFTNSGATTTASAVAFPGSGTAGEGLVPATIATLTYGRTITGLGSAGTPPTAQQIAEGIYSAIVDVQTTIFFTPDAIVIHPRDFETLRLGKDQELQYYGGSFFGRDYGYPASVSGNQTLWNTRVVQSLSIPQGTILVGYFGPECSTVARREGVTMQMTNSNGTDFTNGKVTIRAEERLGLMVYRPKAFELIQLANAA